MMELIERMEDSEQTGVSMLRMFDRYLYKQEHILQEYYYILFGLSCLVFVLLIVLVASNIYWRR